MNACPSRIDGADVICFSPIDSRQHSTGATKHLADGVPVSGVAGVAICRFQSDDGVYLFHCTSDWQVLTDTWHSDLEDAKCQAEFEYAGVSHTWQTMGSANVAH